MVDSSLIILHGNREFLNCQVISFQSMAIH